MKNPPTDRGALTPALHLTLWHHALQRELKLLHNRQSPLKHRLSKHFWEASLFLLQRKKHFGKKHSNSAQASPVVFNRLQLSNVDRAFFSGVSRSRQKSTEHNTLKRFSSRLTWLFIQTFQTDKSVNPALKQAIVNSAGNLRQYLFSFDRELGLRNVTLLVYPVHSV